MFGLTKLTREFAPATFEIEQSSFSGSITAGSVYDNVYPSVTVYKGGVEANDGAPFAGGVSTIIEKENGTVLVPSVIWRFIGYVFAEAAGAVYVNVFVALSKETHAGFESTTTVTVFDSGSDVAGRM
jgi:hypothetical protein